MQPNSLRARRLGLDTQYEAIVFMHRDCPVCRSEGFTARARVQLSHGKHSLIATLYQVTTDLLGHDEAALSESAWNRLQLQEGENIVITHARPLDSLSHLRSRVYGHRLNANAFRAIVRDIVDGRYADIHLASFITACSALPLDHDEVFALTDAMVDVGERLTWPAGVVVDKHSVGGLPGNRTTPILVAIVAALGLTIPKTSSRAITSPAGTADMMETLAPVRLDMSAIRKVVEREGGCVVWGGALKLSPADDILIRAERALDIDTEGQLIASVLSKKIAAGSTHLIIDMPVGPTAKVRSAEAAQTISQGLISIAGQFGLKVVVVPGDGTQPIGRGIGPALEARDVLAVLQRSPDAPPDLRARAVVLAGAVIELAGLAAPGDGETLAGQVLDDGRAWAKFQRICRAQGGIRVPPVAHHTRPLNAHEGGRVQVIDNRKLAQLAKLAGAPDDKAAGVDLHVRLGDFVVPGQPLCTVHSESPGELAYAFEFAEANSEIITVRPE
ncbi:MAG TPA: thymidine phosphorylase family protein [Xanthobacteraceae bacterium]|nr:thymidine phosphorylase family protein [Xanthobacteraceae bacterium]